MWIRDIEKVLIGLSTTSFVNYSGEAQLAKTRQEAVFDNGTHAMMPRKTPLCPALEQTTTAHLHFCFAVGNHWRWFVRLQRLRGLAVALKRPLHLRSPAEGFLRNDGVREETQCAASDNDVEMRWCGPLTSAICEDLFLWPRCSSSLRRGSHSASPLPSGGTGAAEKSQRSTITACGVRVCSGLDLFCSGRLYDYLCEKRVVRLRTNVVGSFIVFSFFPHGICGFLVCSFGVLRRLVERG
ncbi:hypothetical protein C3747_403g18 [Trypanosoma cruzi]|uniref:Uncharacterized protein n=1 Tax=Trypanosoma cruzi TaxID=5693 RepID=A0A2V2UYE0_TRYCR|nr:hypothetical protein C3747_403g18 [Trypanosoma cruzi]